MTPPEQTKPSITDVKEATGKGFDLGTKVIDFQKKIEKFQKDKENLQLKENLKNSAKAVLDQIKSNFVRRFKDGIKDDTENNTETYKNAIDFIKGQDPGIQTDLKKDFKEIQDMIDIKKMYDGRDILNIADVQKLNETLKSNNELKREFTSLENKLGKDKKTQDITIESKLINSLSQQSNLSNNFLEEVKSFIQIAPNALLNNHKELNSAIDAASVIINEKTEVINTATINALKTKNQIGLEDAKKLVTILNHNPTLDTEQTNNIVKGVLTYLKANKANDINNEVGTFTELNDKFLHNPEIKKALANIEPGKLNPQALETYKNSLKNLMNTTIDQSIKAIPDLLEGHEKREQLGKDRKEFTRFLASAADSNAIDKAVTDYINNSKKNIDKVKEKHASIAEELITYINRFEQDYINIKKQAIDTNNSAKQLSLDEWLNSGITDAIPFFENSNHRYAYNEAFDKLKNDQINGLGDDTKTLYNRLSGYCDLPFKITGEADDNMASVKFIEAGGTDADSIINTYLPGTKIIKMELTLGGKQKRADKKIAADIAKFKTSHPSATDADITAKTDEIKLKYANLDGKLYVSFGTNENAYLNQAGQLADDLKGNPDKKYVKDILGSYNNFLTNKNVDEFPKPEAFARIGYYEGFKTFLETTVGKDTEGLPVAKILENIKIAPAPLAETATPEEKAEEGARANTANMKNDYYGVFLDYCLNQPSEQRKQLIEQYINAVKPNADNDTDLNLEYLGTTDEARNSNLNKILKNKAELPSLADKLSYLELRLNQNISTEDLNNPEKKEGIFQQLLKMGMSFIESLGGKAFLKKRFGEGRGKQIDSMYAKHKLSTEEINLIKGVSEDYVGTIGTSTDIKKIQLNGKNIDFNKTSYQTSLEKNFDFTKMDHKILKDFLDKNKLAKSTFFDEKNNIKNDEVKNKADKIVEFLTDADTLKNIDKKFTPALTAIAADGFSGIELDKNGKEVTKYLTLYLLRGSNENLHYNISETKELFAKAETTGPETPENTAAALGLIFNGTTKKYSYKDINGTEQQIAPNEATPSKEILALKKKELIEGNLAALNTTPVTYDFGKREWIFLGDTQSPSPYSILSDDIGRAAGTRTYNNIVTETTVRSLLTDIKTKNADVNDLKYHGKFNDLAQIAEIEHFITVPTGTSISDFKTTSENGTIKISYKEAVGTVALVDKSFELQSNLANLRVTTA